MTAQAGYFVPLFIQPNMSGRADNMPTQPGLEDSCRGTCVSSCVCKWAILQNADNYQTWPCLLIMCQWREKDNDASVDQWTVWGWVQDAGLFPGSSSFSRCHYHVADLEFAQKWSISLCVFIRETMFMVLKKQMSVFGHTLSTNSVMFVTPLKSLNIYYHIVFWLTKNGILKMFLLCDSQHETCCEKVFFTPWFHISLHISHICQTNFNSRNK